MKRQDLVGDVRSRLDGRRLVWFGTRGDDVEGLADLPELYAAISVIASYQRRSRVRSLSFEDLVGYRVDLDAHDIDDEIGTPALDAIRHELLRALSQHSAVLTYRPSTLLSAVAFARKDTARYLGMFKDHQSAFEHKPWVESQIADLGIPTIPWVYIADEEQIRTLRYLDTGPVLLRRSHSSGGTGFAEVHGLAEIREHWPTDREAFVSVAPLLRGGIPLNVGGVVWRNGVTVHPASVQLTGIPELTTRKFGYCGNDFGAVAAFPRPVHRQIQDSTLAVGRWLAGQGYRGAFGVDYLLVDEVPLFTEVNPRLQGSTHLSSQIAAQAGESCILLEHLASLLDIDGPASRSVSDWVGESEHLAHFVAHHQESVRAPSRSRDLVQRLERYDGYLRVDALAGDTALVDPNSTVARVTVNASLTEDGGQLAEPWAASMRAWLQGSDRGRAEGIQ